MARKWELEGPEQDKFSLVEVARLLGYESADSIRALVREGKLPAPRGIGASQYYTGLDVAIVLEMFGRWMPQERPMKPDEKARKGTKADENASDRES